MEAQAFFSRATPVIILDDISDFEATDSLRIRPWMAGFNIPGTAGFACEVQILNPDDSGYLTRIKYITLWMNTSVRGQLNATTTQPALDDAIGTSRMATTDKREGTQTPATQIHTAANRAATFASGPFHTLQGSSNNSVVYPLNILLPHGWNFTVQVQAVNSAVEGYFIGVEVPDLQRR